MIANRDDFDDILHKLCDASRITPRRANELPLPCRQLFEDLDRESERLVDQLMQSPGANEYCLNGDQLKLKYDIEFYRDGDGTNVYVVAMRLGGEQVSQYPEFARAAEAILQSGHSASTIPGRKVA